MNWKDCFKEGKELVLATSSSKGKPNANIVISLGFLDNKLIVADCSMVTTINNLIENPRICVIGGYFKIIGKVEILSSGKYFDKCVKIVASQDKTLKVKNVIAINVEDIFDLEKVKKII
jgi:predicted pyridoxine 5'-phosphate oxidase superfamily flavin-nucleotide-binding protein